jgi:Kef-type K+ transport system membrane component KefB
MGSWIATRKGVESSRERVLIMFGTLYQGEIGVLIAAYLFSRGLVDPRLFNTAIIAVVLLTIVSPLFMRINRRLRGAMI